MILSEFRKEIEKIVDLQFVLEDGIVVPNHFHVTEVAAVNKSYIDCGGAYRMDKFVSFQLWFSDDTKHKLQSKKLIDILDKAVQVLGLSNEEIEVEYQGNTIGKYALSIESGVFILKNKFTNCLAEDQCVVEEPKEKIVLASLENNSCAPGSGCC